MSQQDGGLSCTSHAPALPLNTAKPPPDLNHRRRNCNSLILLEGQEHPWAFQQRTRGIGQSLVEPRWTQLGAAISCPVFPKTLVEVQGPPVFGQQALPGQDAVDLAHCVGSYTPARKGTRYTDMCFNCHPRDLLPIPVSLHCTTSPWLKALPAVSMGAGGPRCPQRPAARGERAAARTAGPSAIRMAQCQQDAPLQGKQGSSPQTFRAAP